MVRLSDTDIPTVVVVAAVVRHHLYLQLLGVPHDVPPADGARMAREHAFHHLWQKQEIRCCRMLLTPKQRKQQKKGHGSLNSIDFY